MNDKKTNKIMATATIAIALSAAIQSISVATNFNTNNWLSIVAFAVILLMMIFVVKLAMDSWSYLRGA